MSMKLKSGMLKIPTWSGFYVGNTRGGHLPLQAVFSCTFEARYYASGVLLGFCVRKKALWRVSIALFTYHVFVTRDAKHPFYLRKIKVNACF